MYSLPSASQMREPLPRTMYGGSPPTDLNARTGESTPPGITREARACSSCDFFRGFIWTLEYIVNCTPLDFPPSLPGKISRELTRRTRIILLIRVYSRNSRLKPAVLSRPMPHFAARAVRTAMARSLCSLKPAVMTHWREHYETVFFSHLDLIHFQHRLCPAELTPAGQQRTGNQGTQLLRGNRFFLYEARST